MIRWFFPFFCAVAGCLSASLPATAPAAQEGDGSPTIWGIPFEEIEARWEGGLREWSLVTEGRLAGSETTARYEQRMHRGDAGWESTAEIELPLGHLDDVSLLLRGFPTLAALVGEGGVGLWARVTSRAGETRWEGRLQLREVLLEESEWGISLAGLEADLEWSFADGHFTTRPRQRITFQSAVWEEVELGRGGLEFELVSAVEWRLHRAVIEWAGGELSANAVAFHPGVPDVTIRMRAEGIGLGELLRLAPEFGGEGEGTIDGELSLRLRGGAVQLEPGHLALRPGEPARLRLPPRAWFTEGMSSDEARYENLRLVERALEDLELRQFRIDFLAEESPDVPLRVTIEGRPLAEDIPAPSVSLTLNVRGPIRELGSWMLSPGVRFGLQ